jgi:Transposase IS66 family
VLILHFKSHASLENIASVLEISHGLAISKSAVCNLLAQAKRYLKGQYDQLIGAVRAGEVMYNDETGWLVNGQKAWLWLMTTEEVTVSFAAESRGRGIAEDLYGESQALSMHDDLASYTHAIPQENHL